mmetsp:Transcript_6872/g.13618  ORF Transcript_6872/g.13618 Transcript_6872/m.13618 type:complete len:80 (-) Transcript_6872:2-241(-)
MAHGLRELAILVQTCAVRRLQVHPIEQSPPPSSKAAAAALPRVPVAVNARQIGLRSHSRSAGDRRRRHSPRENRGRFTL